MLRKSLIALWCSFNTLCFGQEKDSIISSSKWFIPDGVSAQFAGGVGMVSAGILYKTSEKTDFTISAGYVPPKFGRIFTINAFGTYHPLQVKLCKQTEWNVLNAGIFVSSAIGNNIYIKWPEYYPRKYYWWNSSIRYGPFLESEIKYNLPGSESSCSLFFQANTNDLYLSVYFHSTNAVKLSEILVFGTGLRVWFN